MSTLIGWLGLLIAGAALVLLLVSLISPKKGLFLLRSPTRGKASVIYLVGFTVGCVILINAYSPKEMEDIQAKQAKKRAEKELLEKQEQSSYDPLGLAAEVKNFEGQSLEKLEQEFGGAEDLTTDNSLDGKFRTIDGDELGKALYIRKANIALVVNRKNLDFFFTGIGKNSVGNFLRQRNERFNNKWISSFNGTHKAVEAALPKGITRLR